VDVSLLIRQRLKELGLGQKDLAAAAQVTGLSLPLLDFRLATLPLVLLAVLLYVTAGSSLTGSARIGILAAVLAFFVGEIQLQTNQDIPPVPFLGVFVTLLAESPSFLFGLPAFLALVVVVGDRVTSVERGSPGDWVILAILAAGATNAKVVILPLLLVALGVYALWTLVTTRRVPGQVLGAGGLIVAAQAITYVSQYAGHSSGLVLGGFPTVLKEMPVIVSVKGYLEKVLSFPLDAGILAVGGVVVGVAGLLAPPAEGES
jgi:hypothetical protein